MQCILASGSDPTDDRRRHIKGLVYRAGNSRLGIGSGVVYHRISILSQVTSVSKVDRTAKTNSCHSDHAHTQLDTGLVYREE